VQGLERRRIDCQSILSAFSVSAQDFSKPDFFVPAAKMYAIVEELSEISGNPYFGVHIGERLNPLGWSPMAEAARVSGTVGEFLLRFMENAGRDENSVIYILKTIGHRSTFHERRFADGGVIHRHNDGFTVAYLLNTIHRAWVNTGTAARCSPVYAILTPCRRDTGG